MTGIKNINKAEVMALKDQVEYHDGQVVSKTLAQNEHVSVTLFSFDKGEEISTHESGGDAMVLGLDGQGVITIDGREAKSYSSQGQTRTAALALKLAEREIYQNATGEYPVLLLDDVLSELDPRRQEFVLNRIAGGQVFITCCEDDRLPQMLGGKVFHVKQGAISG